MEERIKRLLRWLKEGRAGPLSLEIWPTNRCNLKCRMCGTWASRRRLKEQGLEYNLEREREVEVSEERLMKLIDEAEELGVRECLLTGGGEPMLRKELVMALMKKIKGYGMFGNMNTNGTLISGKDIERIIEMGWDLMMFSLDGPSPKDNDPIRGAGSFQRVKKALLDFKRYKKKAHSEKPKIVFNTVLTNKIYNKLGQMIELASGLACEDITFIPLIVYDQSVRLLELDESQKRALQLSIPGAIKLSEKLGVHTNLPSLLSNREMDEKISEGVKNSSKGLVHSSCFEPFLHFLVKGDGQATCCCMLENSPENIKEGPLEAIWFGSYFDRLRKDFIEGQPLAECKNCVFSQSVRNEEIRESLNRL